ncbi:MAG: uridine kinase, partial [Myxococcota bacterium]
AGKTTLVRELDARLRAQDVPTLTLSMDDFHNPRSIRQQRGRLSPDGYYTDAFNVPLVLRRVLAPLRSDAKVVTVPSASLDLLTDRFVKGADVTVGVDTVILFEGVFLFRPELVGRWDLRIFLQIDFETVLARALRRDAPQMGGATAVERRYRERYIPGQRRYLAQADPIRAADVVVDNRDPTAPKLIEPAP